MKTTLLLANTTEAQQLFADLLGNRVNMILLPVPAEPTREQFDALFATWLRLADNIIVDAVSVGEPSRWALEALRTAHLTDRHAVIVRANELQRTAYPLEPDWLMISAGEPLEQTERALTTFLQLRAAQAKLKQADAILGRQRHATVPPPPAAPVVSTAETLRYRDALKNIAHVLGRHLDENALVVEFLRVVRELLGVGKLAIFTRRFQGDLFANQPVFEGQQLAIVGSSGIAPSVVEHLRLTLDAGIAGYVGREAKILRRMQSQDPSVLDHDPQIVREFELLGTEVAVPMFEDDQLLGVLTFSGKITGDALGNEELELVYHLMTQLAQAIRTLHLQAKVAGQQRFVSEVLAHVQSGVVVVGQDDRLLSVNRRARDLLGLDDGELVGQELNRLPACVADALFEVLQTGKALQDREVTLLRSRRPLRVSAARFEANLGGDGAKAANPLMVVALIEDLTQAKIQEAQARELADKEFFTRLASRLSHELKNSLVSIKIFGQLLPERYAEAEFRNEFSRVVVNEVNRVDMLVNNLTFFSHPLGLVHEDLKLSDLIDASVKSVAQEFNRKGQVQVTVFGEKAPEAAPGQPMITIKRMYDHKAAQIEGDRIRLIQAFEHLLRNAVQSLPAGGRVSISTADAQPKDFPDGQAPEGGAVRIEWLDTGEGIALEQLPHVTEPFMTTRNVGVGLGLTIVKKIIERHSGRVEIDSIFGKGTTVTVLLPVKAQSHPEDALLSHLAEHEATGGNGAAEPLAVVTKPH